MAFSPTIAFCLSLAGACLLTYEVHLLSSSSSGEPRRLAQSQQSDRGLVGLLLDLKELGGSEDKQRTLALHTRIGRAYRELGQYPEAIEHLRNAKVLALASGLKSLVARAQGELGVVYYYGGRIAEAKQELEEARLFLEEDAPVLKGNADSTATRFLQTLGSVLRDMGKVAEALDLYARVLKMPQGRVGGLASLLNDIGRAHLMLGDLDVALSHFEEASRQPVAAESCESAGTSAEASGEAALSRLYIAEVLHLRGDAISALGRYQQVLEDQQRLVRPDQPTALRTRMNIARALHDVGRGAEAIEMISEAERLAGNRREPTTSLILSVKGDLLRMAGRLSESESSVREALAIQISCYGGEGTPDGASTLNALGSALHDQQRYAEAEVYYTRSLQAAHASVGDQSPDAYAAHNNLATLYLDVGRYEVAQKEFTRALEIQLSTVGASSADLGTLYNNLATVLFRQLKFADAEQLFAKAIAAADRAKVSHDNPDRASFVENHKAALEALRRRPRNAAAGVSGRKE